MKIQDTFQQPYDRTSWTSLLADIFPNVSIYQNPQRLENNDAAFVRNFFQLGNVRLADGKNLAIFEVCVDDKIELIRNRVGLRGLIASKIDLGTTHGVLCVFNSSEPTYRFTFVCKETTFDEGGQIATSETNPRKFTYILGPGETRRTAAQRFQELASRRDHAGIKEIVEAFSVERLNKEFFSLYKGHYQAFVDHLIRNSDTPSKIFGITVPPESVKYDAACKPVRDWVKKLLGRIVFIHFIQKKGWMGCNANSKVWNGGDPQFLSNLFASAKDKSCYYSGYLAPLFFDALNTPDRVGDIFDLTGTKVPYLNGGLFDESDESTRKIDFPAPLFKELLDFLSSYNFTIDENDPDENEVGIDPEMLGHIFENLLEENKDKGAYYTPKPVVQFMCQQSLLLYLKTHLDGHEGLENLVHQKDPGDNSKGNWIRLNASRIEALLDQVTICDPAIGSGAFPVGMLQEIFWIKLALDWTLNDAAKFAEIKRRIIEHTIHGVDIDAGAVEIAKLRCWLALVVDEVEPRPLPNLEFKIHCANSLIEYLRGEPVNFLKHDALDADAQKHIKDLENAKTTLFEASRKPDKRAARLAVYQAMTELGKLEFTWMRTQEGFFLSEDRAIELDSVLKDLGLFSSQLATAERLSAKDQDILLNKTEGWYQGKEKPTFAWRLLFAEIFSKGGFSIIIGNPPFIRTELQNNEDKNLLVERFETFTKRCDIYVCFYELACRIVQKKGVVTLITSNKWLRGDYGTKLRSYLSSKVTINTIIDFGELPVFEGPATFPFIFIATASSTKIQKPTIVQVRSLQHPYPDLNAILKKDGWAPGAGAIDGTQWHIANPQANNFMQRIRKGTISLKEYVGGKLFYGIKTGRNEAFFIDDVIRNQIVRKDRNSSRIIYKLAIGTNIRRWSINYDNKWIIFARRGIDIESYPGVLDHLSKFRDILEPKPRKWTSDHEWLGRKAGNYKWYEIQDEVAYWQSFKTNKIVFPVIAKEPRFAYDKQNLFINDKGFIIPSDDLYLLGILNSPTVWRYLENACSVLGDQDAGGRLELRGVHVEGLPIPNVNQTSKQRVVDIVQKIIDEYPLDLVSLEQDLFLEIEKIYGGSI